MNPETLTPESSTTGLTLPFKTLPPAVTWRDDALYLLDQTRLPHACVVEKITTVQEVWRWIHELRVRGAPAIGVAAAYGLCVAMQTELQNPPDKFHSILAQHAAYLDSARPTAVNLSWSLKRMLQVARQSCVTVTAILHRVLIAEAQRIHHEDRLMCLGIGEHGAPLIKPGSRVLTHCNAGALATTGLGTATAPMYIAHSKGIPFRVFVDETRPLLQGARLTAFELQEAGLDVTLITDSTAASVMAQKEIQLVIVGADRVAANGDFANKIGTLSVAIAAHFFGIPFYVACPSSTLDLQISSGAEIVIEKRDDKEVTHLGGQCVAAPKVKVYNPAFDMTPNVLVSGFITERGLIRPPFRTGFASLFPSIPPRSLAH